MLLFDFYFPTAMLAPSISSNASRSSALSHVKSSNPMAFYFLWEKIALEQSFALCISGVVLYIQGDVERGAMGHGLSSCSLCSHAGARPAGWHCSTYHCEGLQCPVESIRKTLHDYDGHWVVGERDISHHVHPLIQWHRSTSNKNL